MLVLKTKTVLWQRAKNKLLAGWILVCLLSNLVPANVMARQGSETLRVVSLLVDETLYQNTTLKPLILRYADDVQRTQNAQVLLTEISPDSSPFDIYEGLASLYFDGLPGDPRPAELAGVILVGDIPLPVVEKGGNLWPTVWPYTDFYEPNYVWDESQERFVMQSPRNMKAEIWHGVIRSNQEALSSRVSELQRFFESNHKLHMGLESFNKEVFVADLVRQRQIVPSMLYWRYEEWIEFAEEIQYLRHTKHWLRRLYERAAQAGYSSGDLSNLSETEKQALADEILEADSGLTREEVMETLNSDGLTELPDNFAKMIIDNLAKRYVKLYENWLTQVHTQLDRSGRWEISDLDSLPELISQKDEASVLKLRYFNDQLEAALIAAVNDANVPHDVVMPHTVPVLYEERGGGEDGNTTQLTYKPAYWNGVHPSTAMTAVDCTLVRGAHRNTAFPFAQQVEANQSMDIDTVDLCKNPSEPDFNSDKYEGCCARNIEYEDNEFGYNTCDLGTEWLGGQNGLASLYHKGAELPVFSYRGTREIEGLEGADGCRAGFADNQDPAYAARFSSLMLHNEPTPESIMKQVSAQFTRALPVDDPRGFSFLDHGEAFHRVDYPNIFNYREAVETPSELELSVQNAILNKIDEINAITTASNAKASYGGSPNLNSLWFWQAPTTQAGSGAGGEGGGYGGGGGDDECQLSVSVQTIDQFTKRQTWTGCGGKYSRYLEKGGLIPATALDDLMAQFDWEDLFEAIEWLDLNIEEKNLRAFQVAMGASDDYKSYFVDNDFNGYEVVQIMGDGSTEQGMEMAFLPEDFDPDFEFLEARGEEAAFVYETPEEEIEFLGEDFDDTFLNAGEESKCDGIPNTTLTWPIRLACSLAATTKAQTKQVSVGPNLGTNDPIEPVIQDLNAKLDGKRLKVSPESIFTSFNARDLIELKVELLDTNNLLQEQDFSTEVTLEFDSSDALDFFDISPSPTLPLVSGKTTFFLVPKGETDYGGKFNLQLVARNENNSGQKLSSLLVPVRLGTYRLWTRPLTKDLVVGNPGGVNIEVKVLNKNDEPTRDFEGETLVFASEGGTFANNGEAQIKNGLAQLRFFPGEIAGDFDVTIVHDEDSVPPITTSVTLLPDLAESIVLSKKSPYLIAGSFYQKVEAHLADQYGNLVDGLPHEWTWDTQHLEIQDLAAYDADPRAEGIQMMARFGAPSALPIRVESGKSTAKIGVLSDFLASDKAAIIDFEVIEDPVFSVVLDQNTVQAGSEDLITARIEARTQSGNLIEDNFKVAVAVEPLAKGRIPSLVRLEGGVGSYSFQPGTLAGDFKLRLNYPGFQPSLTKFTVLPGAPAKVDLSLPNQNPEAVEFAADKPIDLSVIVYDKYRNVVPNWGGQVSLRATDGTAHLIDIPTDELTFTTGKKSIKLTPKNLAGTVRLLAEADGLTLGTLEFKLTSFFRLTDVQQLAPQSLLTLLLGWEAGDLRFKQNFANTWLYQNRTGAVATLAADPRPAYQYGYVSPTGDLGPRIAGEWVSADQFNVLLKSEQKILAQAKRSSSLAVAEQTEETPADASGMWWVPNPRFSEENLVLYPDENLWRYQGLTVMEAGNNGGLTILDNQFKLKSTDDLYRWEVHHRRDYLGDIVWRFEDENLAVVKSFGSVDVLQLKLIDSNVFDREILTGISTNDLHGVGLYDTVRPEIKNRRLGSLEISLEDETGTNYVAWGPDWGAVSHLAGGESIGRSTQLNSSDLLIVYGDPSLKVVGDNRVNDKTFFTQDIGQPIFTAPEGSVRQLFSVDVDADGRRDVLSLTGNKLWVNRQLMPESDARLVFGQAEMWLQVPGGVKSAVLLENQDESEWQILQLDFDNQLVAWRWSGSRFMPYAVPWPKDHLIESLQGARLNDDGYTDLVVVDESHSLWRWSWLGDESWGSIEKIYDFPPNFVLTNESLEAPNLNLKLGFISYDGIVADGVLAGKTTMVKTNPEARPQQVEVDNLDGVLLGNYYDPSLPNPNQINFVSIQQASFLTKADYTTESSTEQVVPGSIVQAQLVLQPTQTLDRVQVMMPRDDYFSLVEGSLRCVNCNGDLELLPASQREMFWIKLPRLSLGQQATISWELRVEDLPDMHVAVGDFEEGFDTLDDIAVGWSEGDDPLMLYFMSSKSDDENPVVKPVVEENEVVEVSQAAIDEAFDNTADPDGDGIPASHDEYPDTANGAESIGAGLMPGMIAGMIGGIASSFLQGGGSCFHQPMSRAQNAPGLATNYNPPHAVPGGSSGGRCTVCMRRLRTYNMPTSTGRSASAVCTGLKRPNMASPAETDNCHVSTANQQFNETCPDSGTNPQFNRLLNNSSSFTAGSMNFQIPGDIDVASLNSKLQTMSGDLPGRLTAGIDKAQAWASEQFVDLNRKTAEAGPGSNEQVDSASYSGESGEDHLRPEGPLEETQRSLEAGDTVNFTREPLPVMIPSTSSSELGQAQERFRINEAAFNESLEAVIPQETENFYLHLQTLVEDLPTIRQSQIPPLPDETVLQAAFERYEAQFQAFANDYRSRCLEAETEVLPESCTTAEVVMTQAQNDFNRLRALQETGLSEMIQAQSEAESAIAALNETGPVLDTKIAAYADSLEPAVQVRRAMEGFVQKFTENFTNVTDLITSATDKVLQIRELQNQVMAATTQMTEMFAAQQEAFQAKQSQRATEWATTNAINQSQHQAEQGVMNQFYNFSQTFQTDVVDRGSLLPWITNNGINGSMPVIKPPVFPHISQEGNNNTPGRMDVTLPEVQVESVDIGTLETMEITPDMPVVSNDLRADMEVLYLPDDPLDAIEALQSQASQWDTLSRALERDSLFPRFNSDETLSGTFTALPVVGEPTNTQSLAWLAQIDLDSLPAPLEPVEMPELPEANTVPRLVQAPLDFAANLPTLPINQKPFTPPPPQTMNKVGQLLSAAQPALQRMGKVGAYRIGASPVSEWHVKPHVERRTGRTSLDGNVDFTASSVEFKPYAELAQNLSIESFSGVTDMFSGLADNWQSFSEGLNSALSFPNNPDLPEVEMAVPGAAAPPGQSDETAYLSPSQHWKDLQKTAFQYRGLWPEMAEWERTVLSTDPTQSDARIAWLGKHRAAWDEYLATLDSHVQQLELENRHLARLAETDKIAFWSNPQVLALVPQIGPHFTADDTSNLNFTVPEREFVTSEVTLSLPTEADFTLEYYNDPVLDLPGMNLADLQSEGIVSGSGDGGLSDREKEDLKNAGLKPGMYYAKSEALGVDFLHKMPLFGEEAMVGADLDGDGENEMIYTLRQRTVYVKQAPSLQPLTISNLTLKQWPQDDFKAARLPLKAVDSTPFWKFLPLEVTLFESESNTFYEWLLRPGPDSAVKEIYGFVPHDEPPADTISPVMAQVVALSGEPTVGHLSRVSLPVRSVDACLQAPPHTIFYDDVLLRTGNEPAKIWSYLHPLRGREAYEKTWTLQPGEELRLRAADVCLLDGFATWQQSDEAAFMARKNLAVGEALTDGSVIELKAGDSTEIQLADGQVRTIEGPLTYYWYRYSDKHPIEVEPVVPLDQFMTYNTLRTWKQDKPSVTQPLVPHPLSLPW